MKDLTKLLEFIKFTNKFQKVIRKIRVTGEDRDENDAEHSFQLAITAWYLIDSLGLEYDLEKIFKYALAHDLVEVYAGDVYFWDSENDDTAKREKEAQAMEKMVTEFPEFKDLHKTIHQYEKREDKESRFVYALDKMIPVLNIYIDEGKSWHISDVSLDMIMTKDSKIEISEDVKKIWDELVKLLKDREGELFPK